MSDAVQIVLIDDHTLFRESLVRLLTTEGGFEVVGHCATVAEGSSLIIGRAVDVVLLDYDLGDEVGTDLFATVDVRGGRVKVIMVTAGMEPAATLNAANAGVAGIVLKHSDPRHLIEAIRRVAAGETWWDPAILRPATGNGKTEEPAKPSGRSITERQRTVLRGILDGLTNKEIASRVQTSETSVKATIQELFNKAGVRTRSQLVRVALEQYSREWLNDAGAALRE
jgi:two-component system nitrate/nitrite response regulator NarL